LRAYGRIIVCEQRPVGKSAVVCKESECCPAHGGVCVGKALARSPDGGGVAQAVERGERLNSDVCVLILERQNEGDLSGFGLEVSECVSREPSYGGIVVAQQAFEDSQACRIRAEHRRLRPLRRSENRRPPLAQGCDEGPWIRTSDLHDRGNGEDGSHETGAVDDVRMTY